MPQVIVNSAGRLGFSRFCRRVLFLLWMGLAGGLVMGAQAGEVSSREGSLSVQDTTRNFRLYAPQNLTPKSPPVPLVLVLHGGGGNAETAERMTGFTRVAQREGFIVVYPEGSGRLRHRLLTWNAGHCCGWAMEHRVDDVGYIRALIDEVSRTYPVDARRIYVTGMSNGGMMTHRLGIALADRVAAIAPVVATVFGDEPLPRQAVSALMLNGQQDASVPPAGGAPGGRFTEAWAGTPTQPAVAQAAFWAQANACEAGRPVPQDVGRWVEWRYACPPGRSVVLRLVKDNGHAWPGGEKGSWRGDEPSASVDATEMIWAFFKAHPKPVVAPLP